MKPWIGDAGFGGNARKFSGSAVHVATVGALEMACGTNEPLVIIVDGPDLLFPPKGIIVRGPKRIEANGTVVRGRGFIIRNASQVYISGFSFEETTGDAIRVENSGAVWIDSCTFKRPTPQADGAIDVVHGSRGVSITQCLFDSWRKTVLIGSHAARNEDRNAQVTIARSTFRKCAERQPKIRYGVAHLVNVLWDCPTDYVIQAGEGGRVLLDSCLLQLPLAQPIMQVLDLDGEIGKGLAATRQCRARYAGLPWLFPTHKTASWGDASWVATESPTWNAARKWQPQPQSS